MDTKAKSSLNKNMINQNNNDLYKKNSISNYNNIVIKPNTMKSYIILVYDLTLSNIISNITF